MDILYVSMKGDIEELPEELISIIYEFDGRYIRNYNVCMYELYTHIYSERLMKQLYRELAGESFYDYIRGTIKPLRSIT